jgi:hypothetical protein
MFELDLVLSYIKVAGPTPCSPLVDFPFGRASTPQAVPELSSGPIELSCRSLSRRWEVIPCRIIRVERDAEGVSGQE